MLDLEEIQDALVSALPYIENAVYDDDYTKRGKLRAKKISDEINNLIREIEKQIIK